MSVEATPHCIYGYCINVNEFKYMIDLINYDTLWDWIEDYNRYEWVFLEEWDDYVYFGMPIYADTNAKHVFEDWLLFKVNTILKYVDLNRLPEEEREEGPYFHVFNIWDC